MKYIAIKERDYQKVKEAFKKFAIEVEELCNGDSSINSQWLDTQDVCRLLNISKRTLQSYKLAEKIPYSMIGNKTYFRAADVAKIIEQSKNK